MDTTCDTIYSRVEDEFVNNTKLNLRAWITAFLMFGFFPRKKYLRLIFESNPRLQYDIALRMYFAGKISLSEMREISRCTIYQEFKEENKEDEQ